MKKPIFEGVATALVTPFKQGTVDFAVMNQLLDLQLAAGVDAVVVCGTTGEASTMTDNEKLALIAHTVKYCAGRCKIIAGTGTNDTAHTLQLSRVAASMGADAVLMVTPYYNKTTQSGLIRHYHAILDACPLPMILYNVPGRTGMGLSADTASALSRHPSVVGLKEASGNSTLTGEILEKTRGELPIYCGNDDQILPMMAQGSCGAISVVSNILPDKTRALTRACLERRMDDAQALQLELMPLIRALFLQVSPIPVKAALAMMGLIHDELRLPLAQMDEPYRSRLKQALLDARLLS